MNTRTLSRSLSLPRPLQLRPAVKLVEQWAILARRLAAWRAEGAERRRAEQAERELAGLGLRTLQDIGAPHGLIGQRRWQDEQDAALRAIGHHHGF